MHIEKFIQKIPCGEAHVTEYYDDTGVVARRDIEVIVDPTLVPGLQGDTGSIPGSTPNGHHSGRLQ